MDARAIGVFDSGLGGLTVVKEIAKLLPKESIIYLGDTARVPYGTRSGELVRKFSFQDAYFLLAKKVKCIVIACNTSSALASEALKRKIKIPVFEVITPPAVLAASHTKTKKVGVIGTRGTILSGAYQKKIKRLNPKIRVYAEACPLLVPFIEEGEFGSALDTVIVNYLKPLKKAGIDTLIMGCTHYPIIEKRLRKFLGKKVEFINPGKAVAEDLRNYLQENDLLSKNKAVKRKYYVTDLTARFIKTAEMFLGKRVNGNLKEVNIEK